MPKIFIDEDGNKYQLVWREKSLGGMLGITPLPKMVERWRANINNTYWYLDTDFRLLSEEDDRSDFDNNCYEVGNYFQTKEQAEAVATAIKKSLEYIHMPEADWLQLDREEIYQTTHQAREAVQRGSHDT